MAFRGDRVRRLRLVRVVGQVVKVVHGPVGVSVHNTIINQVKGIKDLIEVYVDGHYMKMIGVRDEHTNEEIIAFCMEQIRVYRAKQVVGL